jgi:hypothetical protein
MSPTDSTVYSTVAATRVDTHLGLRAVPETDPAILDFIAATRIFTVPPLWVQLAGKVGLARSCHHI